MAQRKGTSSKGRSIDPLQLKKTSATRRDAIGFSLNHRSDALNATPNPVIEDTWANMVSYPARNYPVGQLYAVLTDRAGLWYKVQLVKGLNTWTYAAGMVHASRATVAAYGLGANDGGLLAHLTDYAHLVEWDGGAFRIVDGMGGYIVDAVAALATGWQLCDGTATDYLLDNTTNLAVGAFTTPDEKTNTSVHHNSVAAYTGVINPAVVPHFTGIIDTTGNDSATQTVQSGMGATVPAEPHTHNVTPTGTISLPGDPVITLGVLRYFRR